MIVKVVATMRKSSWTIPPFMSSRPPKNKIRSTKYPNTRPKTSNVTTHEWALANQILPVNLQTLFRQAAENPEIDIQTQLQLALAQAAGTSA